jgi:hypothetical protein
VRTRVCELRSSSTQFGKLFEADAAQLFGVGDRPLRLGGFPVLLLRGAEEN